MSLPVLSTTTRTTLRKAITKSLPHFGTTRTTIPTHTLRQSSSSSTTQSRLSRPLPQGTWDSHMHIVDPTRFPLSPAAHYTPPAHTLGDARGFYAQFGIENMVIVQPSIYGDDNACTLQALRDLTPKHGRAVVQFDPQRIDEKTLREWHGLGVRGVRVNLVSVGRELSAEELRSELQGYARVIRPFGWVLQVYISLKMMGALERVVPELGVKVCVDHFGSPSLPEFDASKPMRPWELPGFASLVNLLRGGDTWVKISGQYRVSKEPELRDLYPLGRELIKEAENRVVYATDWPHTRFEGVDSVPFIEMCYDWCGAGTGVEEKLFRTNAEELWDVR